VNVGKKTLSLLPLLGVILFATATAFASTPASTSMFVGTALEVAALSQTSENEPSLDFAFASPADSTDDELIYPIQDERFDYLNGSPAPPNPFNLNYTPTYEYDPATGSYQELPPYGTYNGPSGQPNGALPALNFDFDDFWDLQEDESLSQEWLNNSQQSGGTTGGVSNGSDYISTNIPRLEPADNYNAGTLGDSPVEIVPSGGIDLTPFFRKRTIRNPSLQSRQQNPPANFGLDIDINVNVVGKIGDNLTLNTTYNTKTTFDFENQLRLEYTGDEDDIIQKLEAGDISFPLPTSLIPGSQSLFGLKTQLQFGRLTVTSVLSQQESKSERITIEKGSKVEEFEVQADQFEENRHFLLAQYFKENYNSALATLPYVNSQVTITNIEVWVTNRNGATTQTRNVIALADLGEPVPHSTAIQSRTSDVFPKNGANDLYGKVAGNSSNRRDDLVVGNMEQIGLANTEDFRLTEARKLRSNEYTFDPQVGYVSLNATLQTTDVLGVAFEYTNIWGETFRVGEFAQDLPPNANESGKEQVLILKMLKSVDQRPSLPLWDLMMRNVYPLGAYQLNRDNFRLDVYYETPGGGITRFMPKGESVRERLLINLLNLDRLNQQLDPQPDGIFDYVEGYTILSRNGRLIFPVLKPFGDDLVAAYSDDDQAIAEQYAYHYLYDTTKIAAQQFPELNRFLIKGRYESSSNNEFSLGAFNIPQGSIVVTAGGARLTEGSDYTVNYSLGRVTIINDAYLNSGIPINIDYEDQALFSLQKKTFIGNRFDYWINDDFNLGATYVHLSQRPFTPKVNYGDDAISNRMLGVDGNYFRESDWITRTVDKLPFYSTKEKSSITVNAEAAKFIPGHAGAIDLNNGGTVFIDDFEGTQSQSNVGAPFDDWSLASTPRNGRFPEAELLNDFEFGKNRAAISWYRIDPLLNGGSGVITADRTGHYERLINFNEVLPLRGVTQNINTNLRTFDINYRPFERGPYNFDTDVDNNGNLLNPDQRWGGLMRQLDVNDFSLANVEFIEFWLLDPFLEDGNQDDDGTLFFNLGTVSEDVLKDGRRSFENGLPVVGAPENTDTTTWARVSKNNVISRVFDAEPANRLVQDVGFDGMDDAGEAVIFADFLNQMMGIPNLSQEAKDAVLADPANDNFVFFADPEAYPPEVGILERYSDYSKPQGNSFLADGNEFVSATSLPDNEDLNEDNALEQSEAFYEYGVRIEPNMQVGTNYITDIREVAVNSNEVNARWYKFQIPIAEYDEAFGGIQGFTSIQFMRMYMTGFEKEVTLRMAEFSLVRNQWRKYSKCIQEDGEYQPNDNAADAEFNVTAVSIEQNSNRSPVNYVLPPGVDRQTLFTGNSSQSLLQNEQSLSIQVCNLEDGVGKGVFKTDRYDMRPFKRLRLLLHAESRDLNDELNPGDVAAVVRIGSDMEFNYYEIEIPLVPTSIANTDTGGIDNQFLIWPDENVLDIQLQDLVDLKKVRNYTVPGEVNYTKPFSKIDTSGRKITLVGSPDLGKVRTIFLGVRNPKRNSLNSATDDGTSQCAEVWFNELALAEFDESGGYAALARVDVKLADLGRVTVTGNMHTAGFGTLEQKVNDRYRDNLLEYDATANINLDKFLPAESGLKIPLYAGYSESISTPQYDAYNTDVILEEALDSVELYKGQEARDSLKRQSQTYQSIKSVNISNARKVRTSGDKKQRPWDVENFNLTLAYTETDYRDPTIEKEEERLYRGSLGYNYSTRPKYITPFKKMIKSSSKYLSLIKDFNFNLVPSNLSFNTELNRLIVETKLRNLTGDTFEPPSSWTKDFTWSRNYGFKWNLTRSISFDFSARNLSRIDEPGGAPDDAAKEMIWNSLKSFGRTLNYDQSANVSYNLPLNKFPLLDWTQVRARYGTTYQWVTVPRFPFPELDTGNTIKNGRNIQLNGELNFSKLYAKSKTLKAIDSKRTSRPSRGNDRGKKEAPEDPENPEAEKKKRKPGEVSAGMRTLLRPLIALKRVSIDYKISHGTEIPGFEPNSQILGNNWEDGSGRAPGLDFSLLGLQPNSRWLDNAASKGWITTNPILNRMVRQTYSRDLTGKATLEPIRDLKIDINFSQRYQETHSEFFKVNRDGDFAHLAPLDIGSYTVSYLPISTMFSGVDETTKLTETYIEFEDNRQIVSQRLADENFAATGQYFNPTDSTFVDEFFRGYGPYAQEVLVPSFIAAYSGKDANSIKLHKELKLLPMPNWSISYNGLSKLPGLKNIFSAVTINHRYSSTYTVNSFRSDPNYNGQYYDINPTQFVPNVLDTLSGNFLPQFRVPDIQISEQLAPLIGFDFSFKNGMTAKAEWKKIRTVGLSLVDYQLNETRSEEFIVGVGFKLRGLKLPFKNKSGDNVVLENDLDFNLDFGIRDDQTFVAGLDQEIAQPTTGSRRITFYPDINYVVNQRIRVRWFLEWTKTLPYTSQSYPVTEWYTGITVSFSLTK